MRPAQRRARQSPDKRRPISTRTQNSPEHRRASGSRTGDLRKFEAQNRPANPARAGGSQSLSPPNSGRTLPGGPAPALRKEAQNRPANKDIRQSGIGFRFPSLSPAFLHNRTGGASGSLNVHQLRKRRHQPPGQQPACCSAAGCGFKPGFSIFPSDNPTPPLPTEPAVSIRNRPGRRTSLAPAGKRGMRIASPARGKVTDNEPQPVGGCSGHPSDAKPDKPDLKQAVPTFLRKPPAPGR